jgi:predicted nucleic-acid-binding Zn-ribbon protein
MFFRYSAPLLGALCLATGALAQSGATVTIPTTNVTALIVDSAYTGATESGTSANPYKTINAALTRANTLNGQGKNVRIRIKAGNGYREQIEVGRQSNTNDSATLTFEGFSSTAKPTLFGSDRWTGNTFGAASPNNGYPVYYHWWGTPWGQQDDVWASYGFNLSSVMRRRETINLGDQTLKRVLTYGELSPGSFYVNENVGQPGYGSFFVCPPAGTTMNASAAFEVGVRPFVFRVNERKRIVFKDLNIQSCADYFDGALRNWKCQNVRIEGCGFAYNGGKGLRTDNGTDYSVLSCSFYKNGITGYGGGYMKNLLVSGVTATFNNWRAANGGMTAWDNAGIKMFQIHDSRIQNSTLSDNYGDSVGLWLDTDVKNVTLSGVTCKKNGYGFFYEAAQGPCTATGCTFSENGIGLYNSAADNLTLSSCTVANNYGESQVLIFGHTGDNGRTFNDFETNQFYRVYGNNFNFNNNKIYWNLNNDWHPLYGFRYNDSAAYQRFQSTLTTSGNRYWHPFHTWVFQRTNGEHRDLTQWKLDTGKDSDALWIAP